MLQKFKNMDELVEYLGELEKRVESLEMENNDLRAIVSTKDKINGATINQAILSYLPPTGLISFSFLRRAFAVYGHFFVANLIISVVALLIYLCLAAVFLGSALGSLPRFP